MDPVRAHELRERLFINKKPTLCRHPVSPSVNQAIKKPTEKRAVLIMISTGGPYRNRTHNLLIKSQLFP